MVRLCQRDGDGPRASQKGVTMTATITRDAIFLDRERLDGKRALAITDSNGAYDVLSRESADVVFVIGGRTGLVARVTRTGSRVTRGCVRVRFDFPRDTGDLAGTLAFDAGKCGGVAPAWQFGL